jgi:hypothetical protein
MDAYDRCINLGEKNLADSVPIYGRGRELLRAPTYLTILTGFRALPKDVPISFGVKPSFAKNFKNARY